MSSCNPRAGEAETEVSQCSLATSPVESASSVLSEKSCLKKIEGRM